TMLAVISMVNLCSVRRAIWVRVDEFQTMIVPSCDSGMTARFRQDAGLFRGFGVRLLGDVRLARRSGLARCRLARAWFIAAIVAARLTRFLSDRVAGGIEFDELVLGAGGR